MNTELLQWLIPYLSDYPEIMHEIGLYIQYVYPGVNEHTGVKILQKPAYQYYIATSTEMEKLELEKHGVRFMEQNFIWAMAYSSSKNVLVVRIIEIPKETPA